MSDAVPQTPEPRGTEPAEGGSLADLERVGWLIFAAAAAAASALILWLGRGGSFSVDELDWLMQTPDLDLGDAFDPHNGHLIATTRLLYKAAFETVGTDYLVLRLMTLAAAVLTATLLFAYASRRIGKLAALAPSLLVLLFGSDYLHLLTGNGFTVLFALACGLAALLALERGDRTGDVAACALLCLGVATYTVALPFVVGVGIAVLLRDDRWRRIWIAAVPAVLYGAWFLYAQGSEGDPQSQTTVLNIFLLPSWGFQSLSATLGAVSGLDFDFSVDSALRAGPTLALVAIAVVVGRLIRGPVPATLWASLGILISLWALGALAAGFVRQPEDSRYLFPVLISVLLVAIWAAAGMRWTRGRLLALYGLAAIALSTNLIQLRDGGNSLRDSFAPASLLQFGALDLAGDSLDPDADLAAAAEAARFTLPYPIPGADGGAPVESYVAVADRYGALGYTVEEIRGRNEAERALVDSILVEALEISPVPAQGAEPIGGCRRLATDSASLGGLKLTPGSEIRLDASAEAAEVQLRRFADSATRDVGTVLPDQPSVLRLPADDAPDSWVLSVSAPTTVCVE